MSPIPKFVAQFVGTLACAAALVGPTVNQAHAVVVVTAQYDFNNNATPVGFTTFGSPTYAGGQLILNGSSFLQMPTPLAVTDNFGMEVIVTPSSFDAFDFYLANGTTDNKGFGLLQESSKYDAILQGITIFGTGLPRTAGTEVRLALVRSAGISTFYLNGVASGTTTSSNPAGVPTLLMIGANRVASGPEGQANGSINEVRLFTFAPGQFSTSDLLTGATLAAAVPEPASLSLLAMGGLALLRRRRTA